jgi:hypothetical protein
MRTEHSPKFVSESEDEGLLRSQSEQNFGKFSKAKAPPSEEHPDLPQSNTKSEARASSSGLPQLRSNLDTILPNISDIASATLEPLSFLGGNGPKGRGRTQSPTLGGNVSTESPLTTHSSIRKNPMKNLRPSRSILFGMESRDGTGIDADGKPLAFFDDHLVRWKMSLPSWPLIFSHSEKS